VSTNNEFKQPKGRGRPASKTPIERRGGIMLCYPLEESRLIKWNVPYFITQPKLDGERCRAICLLNHVQLLSSEMNEITSMPHIVEELQSLQLIGEFDGELYSHDLDFSSIHSRVGRTTNLHERSSDIKYHIFDIVNESAQQIDRLSLLATEMKLRNASNIKVVDFAIAKNIDDIMTEMEQFISNGYEGIIVRHPYATYRRKRSTNIMKFKPRKSDTYTIIGGVEEISQEGVPKGTLGAFTVCSNDGVVFPVGSGLTRDQRVKYWEQLHELVGMEVVVKYQSINPSQTPRFPIFHSFVQPVNIGEKE
jgi:DNA ligase 1